MLRKTELKPKKRAEQTQLRLITTVNWQFQSVQPDYFLQTPQPSHRDGKDWQVYAHKVLGKKCDESVIMS